MAKCHTYWNTYDEFPQHVIVMPQYFMFIGYENSARIISYLLGSKLMQKSKGLVTATPDIDGIIQALNRYHINYIFLQHGEIADSNTFNDNAYEKYLLLSKSVPIYEYNKETHLYDIVVRE